MNPKDVLLSSKLVTGFIIGALMVSVSGCDELGESYSPYHDEDLESGPQPVVNEVDPPDGYLAGIEKITIRGENFNPDPDLNRVHFVEYEEEESEKGEVISASEDQLEVRTGDLVSDNIAIRVEVHGADKFSEKFEYELDYAVQRAEGTATTHEPSAVEVDSEGNLYTAHVDDGSNVGIARIDTDTEELEVVAEQTTWTYQTIRKGPDNGLYMVRPGAIPIIYKVEEGGDDDEPWAMGIPRTDDIDFDENGYLWGAGENEGEGDDAALIRLDENADAELFPFDADVTALRVYEGRLYAAGSQDDHLMVWEFDLGGNSEPGSPEVYFDYTGETAEDDLTLHSMIFSDEGELFIGTDGDKGIVEVAPGGNEWQHFYPEVLDPAGNSLSWKPGSEFMYMAQGESDESDGDLLKINMLRDGAPQYGRDL